MINLRCIFCKHRAREVEGYPHGALSERLLYLQTSQNVVVDHRGLNHQY